MNAANKVALNTGVLYVRMLITMGISLYSTRLVLNYLGAHDFGIFNLVAGIITVLSFLNGAMPISTQRYLSFHQGGGDFLMQKKVFTNSWILHIVSGVIFVALLEIVCPFLFNGFLNIPTGKIALAKAIYHFMAVSVFFTVIAVPFIAVLNAHENMLWSAIVSIVESICKLIIALSLSYFLQSERLIFFGLFTAGTSVVCFLLHSMYCLKQYGECSIKEYQIDKPLLKELAIFSAWTMTGTLAWTGRVEGLGIILNIFFGTLMNAAYGIAQQVLGMLSFFSATLLRALDPQIMRSEGMNDRPRMLRLSMMECKFCFFLIAFIAIPFIFEMPAILKFWLKNVPDQAVIFCQLILISAMSNQLTVGVKTAIQSTGRIRLYQLLDATAIFLSIPSAYFLLRLEFPTYWVFLVIVCTDVLAGFFRLVVLRKLTEFSIQDFCKRVLFKEIIPVAVSVIVCFFITNSFSFGYRWIATTIISILMFIIAIYLMGLCADEKFLIHNVKKRLERSVCKLLS